MISVVAEYPESSNPFNFVSKREEILNEMHRRGLGSITVEFGYEKTNCWAVVRFTLFNDMKITINTEWSGAEQLDELPIFEGWFVGSYNKKRKILTDAKDVVDEVLRELHYYVKATLREDYPIK